MKSSIHKFQFKILLFSYYVFNNALAEFVPYIMHLVLPCCINVKSQFVEVDAL